jgi:hypothetical protein
MLLIVEVHPSPFESTSSIGYRSFDPPKFTPNARRLVLLLNFVMVILKYVPSILQPSVFFRFI